MENEILIFISDSKVPYTLRSVHEFAVNITLKADFGHVRIFFLFFRLHIWIPSWHRCKHWLEASQMILH